MADPGNRINHTDRQAILLQDRPLFDVNLNPEPSIGPGRLRDALRVEPQGSRRLSHRTPSESRIRSGSPVRIPPVIAREPQKFAA